MLLGGLLAANAKLSLRATTALAVCVGFYHGYLNGTGMGSPASAAVALLGLGFAVLALVAIAAAFVVRLRTEWTRITVRVAGSWIVASGLLLLGCAARQDCIVGWISSSVNLTRLDVAPALHGSLPELALRATLHGDTVGGLMFHHRSLHSEQRL